MPFSNRRHAPGLLALWLLACGAPGDTTERAAQSTQRLLTEGPGLLVPRRAHTATLLLDGRVLVAGGEIGGQCELLDPLTGRSTQGALLQVPRYGHRAFLQRSGKVLLVAGKSFQEQPVREIEEYDPQTDTTTTLGTLLGDHLDGAAVMLPSGEVVVLGGASPGGPDIERFDPATGTSKASQVQLNGLKKLRATLRWDGQVWIHGETNTVEIHLYDPDKDQWSQLPLADGGVFHARRPQERLQRNGDWTLTGGAELLFAPLETSVEVTVFGLDGVEQVGPLLATGRIDHSVNELPSGKLVLAGGNGGLLDTELSYQAVASVELVDPASNQVAPIDLRDPPSVYHSATTLPWGDVLLAGGQGDGDLTLLSAVSAMREPERLVTGQLSSPPDEVTQLSDGRVFFMGEGISSLLDTTTLAFSIAPGLPQRKLYSLVPLSTGALQVIGGKNPLGFDEFLPLTARYSTVSGQFSESFSLAALRVEPGVLEMPGSFEGERYLLVAGGLPSNVLLSSDAELCSLQYSSCEPIDSFTDRLYNPRVLLLPGSTRALVAGCSQSPTQPLWLFDKESLQAHAIPGTVAPCEPAMARLPSGQALIHGGQLDAGKTPSSQLTRFDPSSETPQAVGNTATPRWRHVATTLPSGDVLLIGGEDPQGPSAAVERVDGQTLAVTTMPPLLLPREKPGVWPLPSGKLLVTGGDFVGKVTPEVYDPATGASELLESGFVEARGGTVTDASSSPQESAFWVIGGEIKDEGVSTAIRRLDAEGRLLATSSLVEARAWHTATATAQGLLLLGGKGKNGQALASAERITSGQPQGQPAGSLVKARHGHTTTVLASGNLLVVGGEDESGPVEEIEVFSTQSGSSQVIGKLTTPRARHSAIYLESGEVWVVGGVTTAGLASKSERLRFTETGVESVADAALTLGESFGVALAGGDALVVGDEVAFVRRASGEVLPLGGAPELPRGLAVMPSGRVAVCGANDCTLFEPRERRFQLLGRHAASWLQGCAAQHDSVVCLSLPTGTQHAGYARISPPVSEPYRPVLTVGTPGVIKPGAEATVTGTGFTGAGPADQANLRPPRVLLLPDGGPPRMARVTQWSPTSVSFVAAPSAFHGSARLYVSQDGVLSGALRVRVEPSTQSTACASDRECASGFCTDGVCCEQRCQGGCEACSAALQGEGGVDGSCRPIPAGQDPKSDCSQDAPTSCQRTGSCDGARRCQLYPDGTPCAGQGQCSQGSCVQPQPPTCDADNERLLTPGGQPISCAPYRCRDSACLTRCEGDDDCSDSTSCTAAGLCRACTDDRLGVLVDGAPLGCGDYLCKRGECASACEADQDCSPGHHCLQGKCSAYCDETANAAINGSSVTPCSPYRCAQGACASSCQSNLECAPGQSCGLDGRCGPTPTASLPGVSCSATPSPAPGPGAFALLLAASGLAASRRRRRLSAGLTLLALSPTARAADPPAPSASTPAAPPAPPASTPAPKPSVDPEALNRAKEDFRKGVALFEAGDLERALSFFRRSMESYPSKQNTLNAALALDRLERHDEALELYEEVIGKFSPELTDEERSSVPTILAGLRSKVGELVVSSAVDGAIFIDGRARGPVRAQTPLPLKVGSHRVRVVKEGYEPFEATVTIAAGGRASLEARLELLRSVGRLRVESAGAAEVELDGLAVGAAPWEGSLAPGTHVVVLRGDGAGSAPVRAVIVEGQITLLRPKLGKLGPKLRLEAVPETAELSLDGVRLGSGRWEGRLPEGDFTLTATEEGYFPATQRLTVGSAPVAPVQLSLRVDEAHPRWPRRRSGTPWVQAFVGYNLGTSLRSGAESTCPERCSEQGIVQGPTFGLRGGYELGWGLSLEVSGGYLALGQTLERTAESRFPRAQPTYTASYRLDEERALRGPWLAGGASVRAQMGASWSLRGRLSLGVALLSARSRLRGTASTGGEEVTLVIPGAEDTQPSSPLIMLPEVGIESRGPWRFGASLGVLFLTQGGPSYARDQVLVPPSCSAASPGAVGCAPAASLLPGERSHGPTAFILPTLSLSRDFSDL